MKTLWIIVLALAVNLALSNHFVFGHQPSPGGSGPKSGTKHEPKPDIRPPGPGDRAADHIRDTQRNRDRGLDSSNGPQSGEDDQSSGANFEEAGTLMGGNMEGHDVGSSPSSGHEDQGALDSSTEAAVEAIMDSGGQECLDCESNESYINRNPNHWTDRRPTGWTQTHEEALSSIRITFDNLGSRFPQTGTDDGHLRADPAHIDPETWLSIETSRMQNNHIHHR